MKILKNPFKSLLFFGAILSVVILAVTITAFFLDQPVPAMNDEELEQFSNYTIYDGNLYCLDAEKYLGEVCSEIDNYYITNSQQHLYKIKELDVSSGILSYSKGIGIFSTDSRASYILKNPLALKYPTRMSKN